jgi:hypothetical protein
MLAIVKAVGRSLNPVGYISIAACTQSGIVSTGCGLDKSKKRLSVKQAGKKHCCQRIVDGLATGLLTWRTLSTAVFEPLGYRVKARCVRHCGAGPEAME